MKIRICEGCDKELIHRWQFKYCSNKCQADLRYSEYIKAWKKGDEHGNIGILAKNISGHLKRYLVSKYGEHCSECGWRKRHLKSGKVPLEIDHIDGNAENNVEKNLRLLCPNCHALTPYYKNFNRGHGRQWRMDKYIKNK